MIEAILGFRCFPFTKNFGKFLLGISVWERHVPLVTSSIRGSRGMPGHLKDRERYGTGNKDEKSVYGMQISIGMFPPGKRDCLFRNSVYSGKFTVEQTKKSCAIYTPTRFRNFLVNGKHSLCLVHCPLCSVHCALYSLRVSASCHCHYQNCRLSFFCFSIISRIICDYLLLSWKSARP